MARPKSALRKALEEKAAAYAAAAEAAAAASQTTASASTSEWEQTPTPLAATPDTNITTPANTPATTSSTIPREKSHVASELERLSIPGITACNARDWSFTSPAAAEAKTHLAPDFEAIWDGYPRPLTFEENIAGTRELYEKDPGYEMEVVGVMSDVDEVEGTGSVYLEIENRWTGLRMRGFSELKWRRDEAGKWWCFRHTGMRITEEHSGFV